MSFAEFFSLSGLTALSFYLFTFVICPLFVFTPLWSNVFFPLFSSSSQAEPLLSPLVFAFLLPMVAHTVTFVLFNGLVCLVYALPTLSVYFGLPSLARLSQYFDTHYKCHPGPWPWQHDSDDNANSNNSDNTNDKSSDRVSKWWNVTIPSSIRILSLNHFVVVPLLTALSFLANGGRSSYDLSLTGLPTASEFTVQIVCFVIMEDAGFYWMHRLLHIDALYGRIHKVHHMHSNVVCFASECAHPIEMVFGNSLPSNIGPILFAAFHRYYSNSAHSSMHPLLVLLSPYLRCHMLTYIVWLVIRIAKTTDAHCGFSFPASPFNFIPFQTPSEFHDYHHSKFQGNFGSFFTVWDRLCGTVNPNYDEFVKQRHGAKKEN